MSSYEIEIKTLLGDQERADALLCEMESLDTGTKLIDTNSQLNHYFKNGDIEKLYANLQDLYDEEQKKNLKFIMDSGMKFSIRSREVNDQIHFVIKASIDSDSSANGVSRIEFDEAIQGLDMDALDTRVLDAGYDYQAKWSRERKEYICKDVNVCIDKNAGYGYIAEFEKVISDESLAESVEEDLRAMMRLLNVEEIPQDRLERMFEHYNEHWPKYYGTNKVFVIE